MQILKRIMTVTAFVLLVAPGCGGGDGGEGTGGTGGGGTGGTGGTGGGSGGTGGGTPVDGGGDAAPVGTGSYFPLKVGNTWSYKITDPTDGISTKVVTIDVLEKVGGMVPDPNAMAYKHTSAKGTKDKTVGWYGLVTVGSGEIAVNYREQAYKMGGTVVSEEDWWDKYRTKFDERPEHTVKDATWEEMYTEIKLPIPGTKASTPQTQVWKVHAIDEVVTVPAGTFTCLKVSHAQKGTTPSKFFWYARGVGKVKETGGQTEELTAYTLVK